MHKARIFIVEDDDIIAKTTEWRIKKMGHEFCGRAMNGKDAQKYDMAIVYLTSRTDEKTLARARATHPNAYLVKPFDDKDLRVAIELAAGR
jgi:CheY-like chemotaxis protein